MSAAPNRRSSDMDLNLLIFVGQDQNPGRQGELRCWD